MPGSPVLLFLDISGGELLVIMLVVFLVFGPEKMPEMARKAGRMMNQMKKASSDLTREFKKETSVLEKEIQNAHSQASEQLTSVSREFNRTKSEVNTLINSESKTFPEAETSLPKNDPDTNPTPSKHKESTAESE
jgi:sec-independent protein translocase protein TatA